MRRSMFYSVPTILAVLPVAFAAASDSPPDFAKYDKDTLVALCERMHARIADLERQLGETQAQLGSEHGGASATVDGEMASVPDGTWLVKVVSNPDPDVSGLVSQLEAERTRLGGAKLERTTSHSTTHVVTGDGVEARLAKAQQDLNAAQSATERVYDRTDQRYEDRPKYSSKDLATLRMNVQQLEREKRTILQRINRLEREIEAAKSTRQIMAVTDNNVQVSITARGMAHSAGVAMQPGESYRITGKGHFSGSSGRIVLKTASPAPWVDALP